jgi:PAS domain S-box-containing protein
MIGPSSIDRLDREILLQLQVHDQWTGVIDLRDAWGSEFQARAALVVRSDQSTAGVRLLCMHASPIGAVEVSGRPMVTDQVLLHALLESVPDGIYFKDTVGRFLRVSRALAKKFKLKDPCEAIGKTDFDFFNASHAAPAFSDEQTILRTGQPLNEIEEKEEYEDGHATWVSTSKFPFRDPEGMLLGTFGISRDITARKQAEQERSEMETKLQLSQKLESVGRLAAGVAHEINTPTQFISDNVRFLTIEPGAKRLPSLTRQNGRSPRLCIRI